MTVRCEQEGRVLRGIISGELDHHHARAVMAELTRQMDAAMPRTLILDLGELTFTDSSGIAVLIRAYRRMGQLGGTMEVHHTPEQAGRVFRAAGLERLITFKEDVHR